MAARPAATEAAPAPPPVGGSARLRRIVLIIGVTLVAVAGLVAAVGAVLVNRYEGVFGRDDLLGPDARAQAGQGVVGPLNVLLIGSDLRANNPGAGQRSDTIIIVHVTRQLDRAYLVSIPRDLLVAIPAAPAAGFEGGTAKINAAFHYGGGGAGGIQLLARTLTDLTGLRFDGAAVVEFSGLQRAVDVVGGVTMCVDERVVSVHTRTVFEPGCRLMHSTDVLDYLRQRQFSDGDFSRQRHQQQFLKAFLAQALSADMVANPVKLDALLRAVGSSVTVDLGAYRLTDLAYALRDMRPDDLTGIKVPSYSTTWGNQSVVKAADESASLFAALRTDTLEPWTQAHPRWVNAI